MHSKSGPSQRQIRFSEVIREIISDNINNNHLFNDEIELGSITVSFVNVSRDLRIASVYIMPLGGYNKEKILDLINKNIHIFQKAILKEKLHAKYIPKLRFYLDDSFDEAQKIKKLLSNKKVIRDLRK
tara:strand:+ start:209 stop:592 length:384 start_codon:yes stop_codon:yes gene_type:complete